jgi:hypothetical protein
MALVTACSMTDEFGFGATAVIDDREDVDDRAEANARALMSPPPFPRAASNDFVSLTLSCFSDAIWKKWTSTLKLRHTCAHNQRVQSGAVSHTMRGIPRLAAPRCEVDALVSHP